MKRQGIVGFTFDSKAEEWARWADSVLEHNRPRTPQLRARLREMAQDYYAQYAAEARHSPAQQQNGCEIGVTTTRPRNRVLWPLAAGGVVCMLWALVMLASQAGWL